MATETDPATRYRLDDEQRARVRDCLEKGKISLSRDRFEKFVTDIESSINRFRAVPLEGTFREAHDELRVLWKRCHLDMPPVQVLRRELRTLPNRALEYMARRARRVLPQLFPGENFDDDVFDPPGRPAARFLAWASSADDQKLAAALRILSAEGGRPVAGRSRGGGKRSRALIEPMIMGEVRGSGARDHKGGAPVNDALNTLVMHLTTDWRIATSQLPKPGRSDHSGFGDLVHSVCQWLDDSGDSGEKAAYALRRYWSISKNRTPITIPLICADCRWVRADASGDVFFCQKLGIGCYIARNAGQDCGPKGLLFEQAI